MRRLLLGLPAAAAVVLALGACRLDVPVETPSSAPATPSASTSSPSASSPSTPSPSTPRTGVPSGAAPTALSPITPGPVSAGSDGLTVRYLAEDGTVRTVGVEDFPR